MKLMKLCQKCIDAITETHLEWNFHAGGAGDLTPNSVSDSECEFWAHKKMLKVGMSVDVITTDGEKKIFGDVVALSVNEVVQGFALVTVEKK